MLEEERRRLECEGVGSESYQSRSASYYVKESSSSVRNIEYLVDQVIANKNEVSSSQNRVRNDSKTPVKRSWKDKINIKIPAIFNRKLIAVVLAFSLLSLAFIPIITSNDDNNGEPAEITVINVYSYPTVGGKWVVQFTTIGQADLTITAVNGTKWSDVDDDYDLRFLDMRCGNETLEYEWINNSVFVENYSSDEIGYETCKVLTSGRHTLRFQFGDDIEYAFNDASSWWNSSWGYRKLITVNSSLVDADLTNFPMLVNVTDSDLASKAQNDGDDIAFVLYSDNSTQLNHEIESFNDTSGELVAWVNVTSLSASVDTKIWMYYNNSACESQQNVAGTWDSGYLGVWHMEDESGTIVDSTSQNNGTNSGTNQVNTRIGPGLNFVQTENDYVDLGQFDDIEGETYVTFEAYFKLDATTSDDMIFAKRSNNNDYPPLIWRDEGTAQSGRTDTFTFALHQSGSSDDRLEGTDNALDDTNWHYLSVMFDGASQNQIGYLDGIEDAQSPHATSYTTFPTSPDNLWLGRWQYSTNYNFDGLITEARISNVLRNSSWINTTYNMMNSPQTYIELGSEEQSVPILSNPIPTNGSTDVSVPPNSFNITVSDPNGDNMNITWRTNESGNWVTFNVTNGGGSGVGDGTYNATNTSWVKQNSTKYWWSVNVSDGKGWTNETYNFITRPENYVPTINNVYPSNGSTGIILQETCSIQVNDLDADIMTVYWYNSTDGVIFTKQQTNGSVNSGDTVYWTYTQANSYLTTYYWKVAVNDTKDNVTAWYNFTTRSDDATKPSSNVTAITPYWHDADDNPLTITCTDAQDDPGGDGLKNVTLYYYNSTDNITWSGPWTFGVDTDPWVECSWSFTFPNSTCWYQFYSRAADNASPPNIENQPAVNDTECGYDVQKPTSSVDTISPYTVTSSPFTINATASDDIVGVKNVMLWYRYSENNLSEMGGGWWNSNWNYSRTITINHNKIDTDLSNFPVLVVVNSTIGAKCDGGKSIRFLDANGSTEYYYEIEGWNASGDSYVWVNVTSISASSDTVFLMYYNNSNAADDQQPDKVWDSNYVMVHHMKDLTASSIEDSTSNNHDGAKGSANNPIETTGKIWKGQDFSSDQISCGDLRPITAYTAECWIKTDSLSGSGDQNTYGFTIMASAHSGQGYPLWLTVGKGGSSEVTSRAFTSSVTGSNTVGANLNTVDKFHIVATATISSTAKVYVNSVEKLSFTAGSTSFTDIFTIGDLRPGRAIYFDGMIDEVRMSDIVRSDSWINASFRNQNDTSSFLSIGSEHIETRWIEWNDASNPDTSSPWSWNFDFSNGTGYYQFYSIANDTIGNQEDAPSSADASYYYNPYIAPTINSYNLGNSTGSKLNNATGLINVNNEYYFTVNITDSNGWADIEYINITSWYDNGNDSNTYNQTQGGNLNMFLQYDNTTGTPVFRMLWPDDEAQIVLANCTETNVSSTTRIINISFIPGSQIRWASSNDTWDATQNTFNDPWSWNFNITVVDSFNLSTWKIDEYGVYKHASISADSDWVDVAALPGFSDDSSIVTLTYSSNYDYNLTIYFEENLTHTTMSGYIIPIAGNVTIKEDADLGDDITSDKIFSGIGEVNAIQIFNTSGIFQTDGTSQTVDVQFRVFVPLGTIGGDYTAKVATKISHD